MTPGRVAGFMASMFGELPEHVRLLDAGAGMGALTAAFVQETCSHERRPASIDVTAYEVDADIAAILQETLEACADERAAHGISFRSHLILGDYILTQASRLLSGRYTTASF